MDGPEGFAGRLSTKVPELNLRWIRAHHGDDVRQAVVDDVHARTGVDLDQALDARWLDYDAHVALLDVLEERVGPDGLRAMGAYGARHLDLAIPGVDRLLRLLGPHRLLARASAIWDRYADFGDVRAPDVQRGTGTLVLGGFPPAGTFCTSLEGFFEGLIERLGADGVRVDHEACMTDGEAHCRFRGRWS